MPPTRAMVSVRWRGSGLRKARLSAPRTRGEPAGDAELGQDQRRQPLGLVGADRRASSPRAASRSSAAAAPVVEPGMDGERRAVEIEQPRIEPVHRRLVRRVRPAEPGPQHRPAAGEGGGAMAQRGSSGRPMPASASAAFAAAIRSAEVSASVPSRSNTATRMLAPPCLAALSLGRSRRKMKRNLIGREPSPVLQPLLEHRQVRQGGRPYARPPSSCSPPARAPG